MPHTIKNYMEDCVKDMMDPVLKSMDCCGCDQCRYDVLAIALNSLPPKYVVTKKGQLYTKMSSLQQQFDVDTIAAITKAAVIVSRNPRHDFDEEEDDDTQAVTPEELQEEEDAEE